MSHVLVRWASCWIYHLSRFFVIRFWDHELSPRISCVNFTSCFPCMRLTHTVGQRQEIHSGLTLSPSSPSSRGYLESPIDLNEPRENWGRRMDNMHPVHGQSTVCENFTAYFLYQKATCMLILIFEEQWRKLFIFRPEIASPIPGNIHL